MATSGGSRLAPISLQVFKVVIASAFGAFGALKLMGIPMMVQEFDAIGLGQSFRIFTGVIEMVGAVLMVVPMTSRLGSLALLGVSCGAFIAQATILHGDVFHTLVLIAATGFLSWSAWRPSARLVPDT